jgi:hypothetical protein
VAGPLRSHFQPTVSRHRKGKPRRKATSPPVPPRAPRRTVAERIDERPKAPWHPFPLVELAVLMGIACIVVGLLERDAAAGRTLLVLGLALGSLGGLDTAVREHFAGYRSHTLLLSVFPAVAAAVLLTVAGAPAFLAPLALIGVFGAAVTALRRVWARASAQG